MFQLARGGSPQGERSTWTAKLELRYSESPPEMTKRGGGPREEINWYLILLGSSRKGRYLLSWDGITWEREVVDTLWKKTSMERSCQVSMDKNSRPPTSNMAEGPL